MEKMFEKIISEGKKSGKSIEEINAELKAAGANFHLNPDGGVAGWTDAEMEEGFIPAEEEPKEARRTLDMRRRMEFAGTEQIQWIPGGRFAVSYDEDGYAKSAVRLHDRCICLRQSADLLQHQTETSGAGEAGDRMQPHHQRLFV